MHKLLFTLILSVSALDANADDFIGGLAGAERDGFTGVEIRLGYYLKVKQFEIALLPITSIIQTNSNSLRYKSENAAACESLENWNERCNARFSSAAIASIEFKATDYVAFGVGIRSGKRTDFIGTLGLGRFHTVSGKGARFQFSMGGKYNSLGIMSGF
jgi:hypothetical protein